MEAFGIVIFLVIVAVNILIAVGKAKAKQGQSAGYGSAGNQQYYQTNTPRNAAAQPGYKPYAPPGGARNTAAQPGYRPYTSVGGARNRASSRSNLSGGGTRPYNPRPSRASAEAHLCEPGGHPLESERDYMASLQSFEPGYRPYIPPKGVVRSTRNQLKKLTGEEIRKKEEGLRDLRDAGIISHEEHAVALRALGYE